MKVEQDNYKLLELRHEGHYLIVLGLGRFMRGNSCEGKQRA